MDREIYRAETLRLAGVLRDEIRTQGVSIRSLEKKMGVGNSIFQKVLNGKITMTVFHLLQILDGLGLDHAEFFRKVYPIVSPPELAEGEEDELDRRVLNLLRRHGLIDGGDPGVKAAALDAPPAPQRLGFLAGEITVPEDFNRMGEELVTK